MARCLEESEADWDMAVAQACDAHPELSDLIGRLFAQVRVIEDAILGGTFDGESAPEQLGDFRLLERVGGGGMGVVYRADQVSLGRRVALKLIRPENLYFPGARERFGREVEACARLSHPGIVPVFTSGTENGVPFFAMEFIEGCTVADMLTCRSERSATSQDAPLRAAAQAASEWETTPDGEIFDGSWEDGCLRIIRQAGRAVAHAHERGILHRDLKPSNLMIADDGRIRVVDFGLARMRGADGMTRTGSQPGSLPYMAPEQVRGDDVDERTDVYALGVTLYELLTRRRAFRAATSEGLRERILEGRLPPPRSIAPEVSWEAETVTMTALSVLPEHRYRDMPSFVADLENVLERRPIEARRPSWWRRGWRWAQRRPARALSAGLAFVLVALGPSLIALQQHRHRIRLERERGLAQLAANRAREQADFSEAVGSFLVDLLTAADPRRALGEITARELLDRGARMVKTAFPDRPAVRSQVMHVIGEAYLTLGDGARALPILTESLRIARSLPDWPAADVAERLTNVGWATLYQGSAGDAETLARNALAILSPGDGSGRGHALRLVGAARYDQGDLVGAESAYRRAVQAYQGSRGEPIGAARARCDVGRLLVVKGELQAGVRELQTAHDDMTTLLGDEDYGVTTSALSLVWAYVRGGRVTEARDLMTKMRKIMEATLDPESPSFAGLHGTESLVLLMEGRHAEARTASAEALRRRRRALPRPNAHLCRALANHASVLLGADDPAGAMAVASEGLEDLDALGLDAAVLGIHLRGLLAEGALRTGRTDDAERYLVEAQERVRSDASLSLLLIAARVTAQLELVKAKRGAADFDVLAQAALRVADAPLAWDRSGFKPVLESAVAALMDGGRHDDAIRLIRRLITTSKSDPPGADRALHRVRLGWMLRERGQFKEAAAELAHASIECPGDHHSAVAFRTEARRREAWCVLQTGNLDAANRVVSAGMADARSAFPEDHLFVIEYTALQAHVKSLRGQRNGVTETLRTALVAAAEHREAGKFVVAECGFYLGRHLLETTPTQALPYLRRALRTRRALKAHDVWRLRQVLLTIARCHLARGAVDDAEEALLELEECGIPAAAQDLPFGREAAALRIALEKARSRSDR